MATPISDAELVTLLDREAACLEAENDHGAAILLRLAAPRLRQVLTEAARG